MNWKRLRVAILLGFLVMIIDGLLLILVTRLYLPSHAPRWLIHALFYFDAWPTMITRHLFPTGGAGLKFLAIVSGALLNLIILTTITYVMLSWRARRKVNV